MIKYGRHDSTGTTGGGSDYFSTGSIFFTYRQSIREDESSGLEGLFISGSTYIIGGGFSSKI